MQTSSSLHSRAKQQQPALHLFPSAEHRPTASAPSRSRQKPTDPACFSSRCSSVLSARNTRRTPVAEQPLSVVFALISSVTCSGSSFSIAFVLNCHPLLLHTAEKQPVPLFHLPRTNRSSLACRSLTLFLVGNVGGNIRASVASAAVAAPLSVRVFPSASATFLGLFPFPCESSTTAASNKANHPRLLSGYAAEQQQPSPAVQQSFPVGPLPRRRFNPQKPPANHRFSSLLDGQV